MVKTGGWKLSISPLRNSGLGLMPCPRTLITPDRQVKCQCVSRWFERGNIMETPQSFVHATRLSLGQTQTQDFVEECGVNEHNQKNVVVSLCCLFTCNCHLCWLKLSVLMRFEDLVAYENLTESVIMLPYYLAHGISFYLFKMCVLHVIILDLFCPFMHH